MIPDKKIFDQSDRGLLESVSHDDQIAFKEIFKRYWSKLYIYAYNVLHDKDIGEDINRVIEIFEETQIWNLAVTNNDGYAGFISKSFIFNKYISVWAKQQKEEI